MEYERIVDHLKDKSILVTGSTGFLGKVFVEKILRVQPNVKKLFLLVRTKDAESAMQRVQSEVIEKELFKLLKEEHVQGFHKFILEKVSPIAGDIVHENLGIQDIHLKELLWNEIDFVVNIAATTNFYDRYDVALSINTFGAKNVLEFAKKCMNLQRFLHVSTAFVSGNKKSGLIAENPCRPDETLCNNSVLDIEVERRLVEERKKELRAENSSEKDVEKVAMKKLGLMRAKHFGWPNTYAFTKAMGEMLLGQSKETTHVSILRPTIVTSIYRDPLPGWIEGTRTIDSFIIAYDKGQLPCVPMDTKLVIDLIPGDMVVNAMIVTITHSNESSEFIYHISSSRSNPVTYSDFLQSAYRYFDKNPHMKVDGKRKKMKKILILKSRACFHGYMMARYGLPLKALCLMNVASCLLFSDRYTQYYRKYKSAMFLIDLYKPYIFFNGMFDDSNMKKLRLAKVNKIKGNLLDFDPTNIEWGEYITNIHIPGLLKYAGN